MKKETILKWFYWKLIAWVSIKYYFVSFLILVGLITMMIHFGSFFSPGILLIICLFFISVLPYYEKFKEKIERIKRNYLVLLKDRMEKKKEKYEGKRTLYYEYACRLLFSNPESSYLYLWAIENTEEYVGKISKCQDLITYIELEQALSPRSYSVVV